MGFSIVEKVCLSENSRIIVGFVLGSKQKTGKGGLGLPEGLDKVEISELMEVDKSLENFDVEVIPVVRQQRAQLKRLTQNDKNNQRY